MTTWTFKGPVAALAFLALSGCEAGQGFGLSPKGNASAPPLSRAKMVKGVTLVAPRGFCIDQTSLEPRFAVMARCDGLGVAAAAGTAPRGLITVSLADAKGLPLPTAQHIATASQLSNMELVDEQDSFTVFRARGRIPVGGFAPTQWRAAAKIGSQTAGVAVYGPENGEIITSAGRDILLQLIERSVEATP